MITESYVSFETAKLLKEAGFDVPCEHWYDEEGLRDCDYKAFQCPTQSLAARWLREVHKIHAFSCIDYGIRKWFYGIAKINAPCAEIGMEMPESYYETSESALEAGLQEAIKLIKSKDYDRRRIN